MCTWTKTAYSHIRKIRLSSDFSSAIPCARRKWYKIKERQSRKENVCQDFISSKTDFQVKKGKKFITNMEELKNYWPMNPVKTLSSICIVYESMRYRIFKNICAYLVCVFLSSLHWKGLETITNSETMSFHSAQMWS